MQWQSFALLGSNILDSFRLFICSKGHSCQDDLQWVSRANLHVKVHQCSTLHDLTLTLESGLIISFSCSVVHSAMLVLTLDELA